MIRAHLFFMFFTVVLLLGCSKNDEDTSPTAAKASESIHAETCRKNQVLTGQEVYEAACASCHDQGEGDAPATGDQGSWSGRSDLWTAVLSEHAKAGYLDMPEKGGHGELSDEAVSAAVEYMMLKTYPEKPRD